MALAWAASPRALVRYSLLGIVSSAMPPIAVYLGASLVNRIAQARLHSLQFTDMLPIVIGLWLAATVQRAVGAYTGYGRNLFVRRVQLEAHHVPRRLLFVSGDRAAGACAGQASFGAERSRRRDRVRRCHVLVPRRHGAGCRGIELAHPPR
jgi:hypothetical protein